jgi:hypothetical protein
MTLRSGSYLKREGRPRDVINANVTRELSVSHTCFHVHAMVLMNDVNDVMHPCSGSYLKREGRPRDDDVLVARLVDRPLRPMLEKGWCNETQVRGGQAATNKGVGTVHSSCWYGGSWGSVAVSAAALRSWVCVCKSHAHILCGILLWSFADEKLGLCHKNE